VGDFIARNHTGLSSNEMRFQPTPSKVEQHLHPHYSFSIRPGLFFVSKEIAEQCTRPDIRFATKSDWQRISIQEKVSC